MTITKGVHEEFLDYYTANESPAYCYPNCSIQISNISADDDYHPSVSVFYKKPDGLYKSFFISKGEQSLNQAFIENIKRINEIARLTDNWNENGAPSFPAFQIEMMKHIVNRLNRQPFITPTANGSIQFEYENKDDYLEFELFSDGRIKVFSYFADGKQKTDFITAGKVNETIENFYKRTSE